MSSNARPGHSAGHGVSPKLQACGLRVHGPPKPRTSIAFDLRQEPGAGKPHAGICAGGPGQLGPLPLQFPVHPHMLRHATGYKLANDGQDTRSIQHYLGHRNIEHTTRYTELRSDRFRAFWSD